jgi:glycerophosphoryl diester phosphodiesterase
LAKTCPDFWRTTLAHWVRVDLAHWVRVESDVKMTPLPSPDRRPVVCGHRGAPTVQPENTLASFAAAEQRGATWVEFDVRPTGDGQLAIHHDPVTIDGIRLGSTGYRDLDSAIPRFGDLVAASPALGLDIEMKTDDIDMSLASFAELVVHEIGSHCSPSTELMVTSFDADALRLVRELQPDLPTGLLFWKRSFDEALAIAQSDGHGTLAPWIRLLSADLVEQARAASLRVVTWTVNEPADVQLASSLGVDMIIGDDPAVILENL